MAPSRRGRRRSSEAADPQNDRRRDPNGEVCEKTSFGPRFPAPGLSDRAEADVDDGNIGNREYGHIRQSLARSCMEFPSERGARMGGIENSVKSCHGGVRICGELDRILERNPSCLRRGRKFTGRRAR